MERTERIERSMIAGVDLTWNIARDVNNLFAYHFMVNAFRAGTAVAIVAAVVGWFMVLREETFAGHTLSVVGFPGAAGAVWLGVSASLGFFASCVAAALLIAALPRRTRRGFSEESAVIGTLQAFALACGLLFASLYAGFLNGVTALLFGNFLGITDSQVATLVITAAICVLVLALVYRPLLFASVDPDVATARGIPSRALSVVFLVALGVAVAAAAQITGALLVFALLVVPAAAAQAVTARPVRGLVLAVGFALAIAWAGLAIAYYSPYPVGFWISAVALVTYAGARLLGHVRGSRTPRATAGRA
jgi:zinc/manganese transport system permease protein